ncbi:MAG: hypothetical protein ACFFD8_07370 [Candidatus Thorarchaeota archaeon]
MVFPSPNPVWIVELGKLILMFLIGGILLFRWYRAEVRFYTDIPFLFGIAMFFAGAAEGIDFFIDSGLAESLLGLITYTLPLYQIRVSLTVITLTLWLAASVLIWTTDRKITGYAITLIYAIATLAAIWFSPTIEIVRFALLPFLAIAFFVFIITFMLAWYWKRLPDVNGLIMSIGAIIALAGQVLKNPLDAMGIIWVSELIDLIGIIILTAGLLIKPHYSR